MFLEEKLYAVTDYGQARDGAHVVRQSRFSGVVGWPMVLSTFTALFQRSAPVSKCVGCMCVCLYY